MLPLRTLQAFQILKCSFDEDSVVRKKENHLFCGVCDRRPDYAPDSSSDEEDTVEVPFTRKSKSAAAVSVSKEPNEAP